MSSQNWLQKNKFRHFDTKQNVFCADMSHGFRLRESLPFPFSPRSEGHSLAHCCWRCINIASSMCPMCSSRGHHICHSDKFVSVSGRNKRHQRDHLPFGQMERQCNISPLGWSKSLSWHTRVSIIFSVPSSPHLHLAVLNFQLSFFTPQIPSPFFFFALPPGADWRLFPRRAWCWDHSCLFSAILD